MKILICIAGEREININIVKNQLKDIYLKIKYTGIGVKDKESLKHFIKKEKFSHVINAGTAGIVSDKVNLFDIILPSVFYSFKDDKVICCDSIFTKNINKNWKRVGIITVDKPITSIHQKSEIQKKYIDAGIVDMESYYISKICNDLNIHFISIKVATDYCNTDTTRIFYKNLSRIKEILTSATIELIKNLIKNE